MSLATYFGAGGIVGILGVILAFYKLRQEKPGADVDRLGNIIDRLAADADRLKRERDEAEARVDTLEHELDQQRELSKSNLEAKQHELDGALLRLALKDQELHEREDDIRAMRRVIRDLRAGNVDAA